MGEPAKKEAIDLIQRLPEESTLSDIIEELFFKQQVDEGLREVEDNRVVSHQEFKERLKQWRRSAGR